MKKDINLYILSFVLLIAAGIAGCKKDEGFSHNASQPITIESFIPETGSGGTQILISGSNFTTDTSKISVTINGRKLKVIGVNGNQVMVVIPKKLGSGPIKVSIGEGSATSAGQFTYQYTRTVSTLAGSGIAGFANGQGADAMFNFNGASWYRSSGIAVDDLLNVYVADVGNHCIRKIDSLGNVTTLAGDPNVAGYADGKGTAAKFNIPYGLTIDKQGNLYSVDPTNWDIRKISPDGTASTIGWAARSPWAVAFDNKTGTVNYLSTEAPGSVFRVTPEGASEAIVTGLIYPLGIVFDSNGNLYIAEHGNQVIRKYTAGTWQNSIIAGQAGVVGWVDGPGAQARFAYPWGMGIDKENNLYVAGNGTTDGSAGNPDQSIRFIDANTYAVSTFAGSGTAGYTDGIGKVASFFAPGGVTVDKNGTVYVLDKNNNRVRKIISE